MPRLVYCNVVYKTQKGHMEPAFAQKIHARWAVCRQAGPVDLAEGQGNDTSDCKNR